MGEGYEVTLGPLEWDFIPRFGDGKITARLRQLTVLECDTCITSLGGVDRPQMLRCGLIELTGCSAGGEKITTAKDLLAASRPLMPLYMELWLEIQKGSEVTEEEVKNS